MTSQLPSTKKGHTKQKTKNPVSNFIKLQQSTNGEKKSKNKKLFFPF